MKSRDRGFTILELLIVVAVIAILSAIVMVSINSARAKGRDTKRIEDIRQINIAIALYQNDHQGLPPDLGSPNPCGRIDVYNASCFAGSGGENWSVLASQLEPYLRILPTDPCPTCVAGIFDSLKVYAAENDFEYIYHAPAAVHAYLVDNGVNPTAAGISSQPYSIFAKRLEKKVGSFGFGLSVPTILDLAEESTVCPYAEGGELCSLWELCSQGEQDACVWLENNICPYIEGENGTEICEYWALCEFGDEGGCKWLAENIPCPYQGAENGEELCTLWQECNAGGQESCEILNQLECPYTSQEEAEKYCAYWTSCETGDKEACEWIGTNAYCPYQEAENGEEMCKYWDECYKNNNEEACAQLP